MLRFIRRSALFPGAVLALASLVVMAGCAVTRGAPKLFLGVESTIDAQQKNKAMIDLALAGNADRRNLHLGQAMSDVDVLYVQFRDQLLRGDNRFNAGMDLVGLMADLAGSLTSSAGVKDNYFALGALINGGRATINNRFLYAQTSMALVKGMDAARASTALAIKHKQSTQTFEEYGGRDAYADVLQYYFDGTLAGGLVWLQANAAEKEAQDRQELATLRVPTSAELLARESLQEKVAARLDSAVALRRVLAAWHITAADGEPLTTLRDKFLAEYRERLLAGSAEDLDRQLTEATFFED